MESSNILVVEDNAAHAELISLAFEPDAEFRLQVTPCLQEARAVIAERPPELVITDLLLPDGRGIELLPSQGRSSKFPIVVMTSYGDERLAVEAMRAGAVNYLVKSEQALADLPRIAMTTLREWGDVVERRKAEAALLVSERRYRTLFDDNPSMCFTVDATGVVMSANRYAADQLGREVDEMVGRPLAELHVQPEVASVRRHLAKCFREPMDLHRWDTSQARRDGTPIWVNVTARVVQSPDAATLALIVCEGATATRQLSDDLIYPGSHDPLTGLAKRRKLERCLQQALSSAQAEHAEHALCYLSLDQFTLIHDDCGPAAGDELLRQFSNLLKRTLRRDDTLARLSEDEFGIVLMNCSAEDSVRVAKSLRKAAGDFCFRWESRRFDIDVSVGLVPITEASGDSTALLAAAHAACLAARGRGRNCVQLYDEDDAERVRLLGEDVQKTRRESRHIVEVPPALEPPIPGTDGPASDPVEQPISTDVPRTLDRQSTGRSSVSGFGALANGIYRILHVDDDPVSRMVTEGGLSMAGFEVWSAESGQQALDLIAERGLPHLALVDIFMPGMSGLELCAKIQTSADLPIIMVTSVDDSQTEEETLRQVAEDYVTKPFDLRVLVARVERLLRRIGDFAYALGPRIRVDDHLEVELGRRRVYVDGQSTKLTRTETKLLYILMRNAGQTVTNGFLLRRVWPQEEIYENVLRTHVARLRKKLEHGSGRPRYVMTRRGLGYYFKARD